MSIKGSPRSAQTNLTSSSNVLSKDFNESSEDLYGALECQESIPLSPPKIRKDINLTHWRIRPNTNGNNTACISFLPQRDVQRKETFRAFDKYFIRSKDGNSLYTSASIDELGVIDPAKEFIDYIQEKFPRKTSFQYKKSLEYSPKVKYKTSIYVHRDDAHPENVGKVFLFDMSSTIHKFYVDQWNELGYQPCHPLKGTALLLKLRTIHTPRRKPFKTFEDSYFLEPRELFDDRKKIQQVLKQSYDLDEVFSVESPLFQDYREASKKLNKVLLPEMQAVNYKGGVQPEDLDEHESNDWDIHKAEMNRNVPTQYFTDWGGDSDSLVRSNKPKKKRKSKAELNKMNENMQSWLDGDLVLNLGGNK